MLGVDQVKEIYVDVIKINNNGRYRYKLKGNDLYSTDICYEWTYVLKKGKPFWRTLGKIDV